MSFELLVSTASFVVGALAAIASVGSWLIARQQNHHHHTPAVIDTAERPSEASTADKGDIP